MAEIEKTSAGKHGKCSNCGRDNLFIANKDGHCCTCKTAVKGLIPGSPEYITALSGVKERLSVQKTNQNRKLAKNKKGAAPDKPTHPPAPSAKKQNGGNPMSSVLGLLISERDELMVRVGKYNQAIELLS